jgi:hypothetical protein
MEKTCMTAALGKRAVGGVSFDHQSFVIHSHEQNGTQTISGALRTFFPKQGIFCPSFDAKRRIRPLGPPLSEGI